MSVGVGEDVGPYYKRMVVGRGWRCGGVGWGLDRGWKGGDQNRKCKESKSDIKRQEQRQCNGMSINF